MRVILSLILILIVSTPALSIEVDVDHEDTSQNSVASTWNSGRKYHHNQEPIRIMGDRAYAPYSFINKDGDNTGFMVDIIEAVFNIMDIPYTISLRGWTKCLQMYDNGDVDVLISVSSLPKNKKKFDLSDSVINFFPIVVCTKNHPSIDWNSLDDKKVIIQEGSVFEYLVGPYVPVENRVYVDNVLDAISLVSQNKYDFAVVNRNTALYYVQNYKFKNIAFRPCPIESVNICFGVRKGDDKLRDQINEGLARIKKAGVYDQIYNKWYGYSVQKDKFMSRAGYITLYVVLGILFLLSFFVLLLRVRINRVRGIVNRAYEKERLEFQQNSAIMASLPVGVATYDKEGMLTYINEAFVAIFGIIDARNYIEEGIYIYDDPLLGEAPKKEIRRGKDVDGFVSYEPNMATRFKHFTSVYDYTVYLEYKIRFVRDDDNQISSIVMLVNNITDRLRQNQEMEHQRDRLQIALDIGNISALEFDIHDNVVRNLEMDDVNEITFQEFLNTISTEDLQIFLKEWNSIIMSSTNEIRSCVVKMYNNETDQMEFVQIKLKGRYDDNNNLEKIIGAYRNVNKEYLHEEEINKAFSALNMVIKTLNINLFNLSFEDGFLYAFENSNFNKIETNLIRVYRHVHPADYHIIKEMLTLPYADSEGVRKEVIRAKKSLKDESYNYYEATFIILNDKEDIPLSLLISMRNVTKIYLHKLRQENKLKSIQDVFESGHIKQWYYYVKLKKYSISLLDESDEKVHLYDEGIDKSKMHPDDYDNISRLFKELISGEKENGTCILRVWDKEANEYNYTEQSVRAVKNNSGEVVSIIGISKNYSKLFKLKDQLNKQSSMLDLIYKNLTVGICLFDANGYLTEANPAAATQLGYNAEIIPSLIGTVNLFDDNNFTEKERELLRNGSDIHKYHQYNPTLSPAFDGITNESRTYYHNTDFLVIKDKEGNTTGYMSITSDLTDWIAEKERSEKLGLQFDVMFKSEKVGIAVRDKNGILTKFNSTYSDILGIEDPKGYLEAVKNDVLGNMLYPIVKGVIKERKELEELHVHDFDDIRKRNLYKTSRTGLIYVEVKVSPLINAHGDILGTISTIRDVTIQHTKKK